MQYNSKVWGHMSSLIVRLIINVVALRRLKVIQRLIRKNAMGNINKTLIKVILYSRKEKMEHIHR